MVSTEPTLLGAGYVTPANSITDCSSPSTASIVILIVGILLSLIGIALVLWVVFYLKKRKDQQKPRPMAPRVDVGKHQASGEYIDFQEESNRYESMEGLDGKPVISRYVPSNKDAMHETFDGSRMPKSNAPKPPKHPAKSVISAVKKEDGLTESGNNVYEDCGNDTSNNGGVIDKLKGRISKKFDDASYETPAGKSTTLGPLSKSSRPPTLPKRSSFR